MEQNTETQLETTVPNEHPALQTLEENLDAKQFENEVKQPVIEYKKEILVGRLESMADSNDEKKCVEIRIMPEYMSVNHKPVKYRQLYGDLIYTHDSDLVAVLMHLGYFRMMDTTPIGMVTVKTIVRILPDQPNYPSFLRNNLLSREWNFRATEKKTCAYKVEGCWLVKRNGTLLSLKRNISGKTDYIPTFVPAHSDRAVATRSTTATAERRQRNLPEQTFVFNLSNEISMKYSIFAIADSGLRPTQWTSTRLQGEVMYLETKRERYELSRQMGKTASTSAESRDHQQLYLFAKCLKIMNRGMMESCGIPLPSDRIEELDVNLAWEDIKWGQTSVKIGECHYHIIRLYYLPRC